MSSLQQYNDGSRILLNAVFLGNVRITTIIDTIDNTLSIGYRVELNYRYGYQSNGYLIVCSQELGVCQFLLVLDFL